MRKRHRAASPAVPHRCRVGPLRRLADLRLGSPTPLLDPRELLERLGGLGRRRCTGYQGATRPARGGARGAHPVPVQTGGGNRRGVARTPERLRAPGRYHRLSDHPPGASCPPELCFGQVVAPPVRNVGLRVECLGGHSGDCPQARRLTGGRSRRRARGGADHSDAVSWAANATPALPANHWTRVARPCHVVRARLWMFNRTSRLPVTGVSQPPSPRDEVRMNNLPTLHA